ncbi:ornithine carbamoyltransferase [Apiospora arundinis]
MMSRPRVISLLKTGARGFHTTPSPRTRHLMTIGDLSKEEFTQLVRNAASHKKAVKSGNAPQVLSSGLLGKTVAMMFSKRSTRTRVSTEAAVAIMGGHPMFLGKDDIQLGVNESLYDTSKIISSMTSCMVARVGPHSDVTGLTEGSTVPVINALSNDFHPLQTIADFLTIHEAFPRLLAAPISFDLLGVQIAVASPTGYTIPKDMEKFIRSQAEGVDRPGQLDLHTKPADAIKNADILVTDTWVSMGQEEETKKRLQAFEGFQITNDLAAKGGAKDDWKFMHCLPRHQEEVDDAVFYGPRSLVFPEGENRLWAAVAALEAFVVNKGRII